MIVSNINIIIFSKDRAPQLEVCIRSLKKHFQEWQQADIVAIYFSSSSKYEKGYNKLKTLHPEITYVKETTLKEDIIASISLENKYTMFLVDDDLFKNDFSIKDEIFTALDRNNKIISASLRLHKGITYGYNQNGLVVTNPEFIETAKDQYLVWSWKKAGEQARELGRNFTPWEYECSVDGDVFRTNQILKVIKKIDFVKPNSFETALNNYYDLYYYKKQKKDLKICYDSDAKLFGVPINQVQTEVESIYEPYYSTKKLNKLFLKNKVISLKDIDGMKTESVHVPIQYSLSDIKTECIGMSCNEDL